MVIIIKKANMKLIIGKDPFLSSGERRIDRDNCRKLGAIHLIVLAFILEIATTTFAPDLTKSLVTWSGGLSQITSSSYTVTAEVKDSDGNPLNAGDIMYLDIRNKCTWSGDFVCIDDALSSDSLSDIKLMKMTSHNNGTYTKSYTIDIEGDVTLTVIGLESGAVQGRYYT